MLISEKSFLEKSFLLEMLHAVGNQIDFPMFLGDLMLKLRSLKLTASLPRSLPRAEIAPKGNESSSNHQFSKAMLGLLEGNSPPYEKTPGTQKKENHLFF